ncbi:MAG: hypothetical protein NTX24_03375 [Candidatus Pacearchaeota archaeon]|nr:hypothetical protein [Candidatus Pacearchaeota archaeon]
MKKGFSKSLTVVIVLVLLLGLVSVLIFMEGGILNPVLKFFGISGKPIFGEGETPEEYPSYPEINTSFEKISDGNYNVSWSLVQNNPDWKAQILRTNFSIRQPNGTIIPVEIPNGQQYTIISGDSPLFAFLNFTLDIKHGKQKGVIPILGDCKPQCIPTNLSHIEGPGSWIDFCTNPVTDLKDVISCPEGYPFNYTTTPIDEYFTIEPPYCCFIGTGSEGWYTTNCTYLEELWTNCTESGCLVYRIGNASAPSFCELGNYSVYYEMGSDDSVIFEQELIATAENTSINWFTDLDFIGNEEGIDTSGDLLNLAGIDYVSRWNSSDQKYYGSAEGIQGGGAPIVIGSFNLDRGKPYFTSVSGATPGSNVTLSYAGEVPSAVTFGFKKSGDFNYNYVSLTLDTNMTNASNLCNITDSGGNLILDQTQRLSWWNPLTQSVEYSKETCQYIMLGGEADFLINPGEAYQIIAQRNATWTEA